MTPTATSPPDPGSRQPPAVQRWRLLFASALAVLFLTGFLAFPSRAEQDRDRLLAAVDRVRGSASYAAAVAVTLDGTPVYSARGRVQPMARRAVFTAELELAAGRRFRFTAWLEPDRVFLNDPEGDRWFRVGGDHPAMHELSVFDDPLRFWSRLLQGARRVSRLEGGGYAVVPQWAELEDLPPIDLSAAAGGVARLVLDPAGQPARAELEVEVGPAGRNPGRYVYTLDITEVNRADPPPLPPEATGAADLP